MVVRRFQSLAKESTPRILDITSHIYAHSQGIGMLATEVEGVALPEIISI
jgi:hypothetical protein